MSLRSSSLTLFYCGEWFLERQRQYGDLNKAQNTFSHGNFERPMTVY